MPLTEQEVKQVAGEIAEALRTYNDLCGNIIEALKLCKGASFQEHGNAALDALMPVFNHLETMDGMYPFFEGEPNDH